MATQFTAHDQNDAPAILPIGLSFATFWVIVADEQEAAWTMTAVGERAPVEVSHPSNALDVYDDATLARYCIDREEVADPPPPVPALVSRMQAKRALLDSGLLPTVEAAIAASDDAALQLYWAEASDFHRDHPALIAMTAALGMTSGQVDDLFISAAAVV